MLEVRTGTICLVRLTAIRYEYTRSLSALDVNQMVSWLRETDALEIDVP